MFNINGSITAPLGFLASGINCGIRKSKTKRDLALIYSKVPCTAAAVYTLNKVKGAPLTVTAENIKDKKAQAIICNSGNANTCNPDGMEKAQKMCVLTARELSLSPSDIIVASTGVIGQPLPIEPIEEGLPQLVRELSADGAENACEAIMTTDLIMKQCAVEFTLDNKAVRIGAIAKGSGMINPNMATMLAFVTTDAAISGEMLQKALTLAVDETFNMISVDGDTSTNDMVAVLANGLALKLSAASTAASAQRANRSASGS